LIVRTALALVLTGVLLGLAGCYQPDLRMILVRPSAVEPPPYEGVRYEFEVENRDYPADRFGPTAAAGPVTVQGYLSSDGVARDGGAAGEVVIVPTGNSLAVGARLAGSYQAAADLDPSRPFLILAVIPSSTQTDHDLANNSLAEVISPTPSSNLGQWLIEHPWIKRNLIWERPGGAVDDYDHWDDAMKSALQSHVDGIRSGTPLAVADPPPLAITPTGTENPETTVTRETAQTIFLAHVARSIVSDEQLPWKARELNDAELAVLFDSRRLFRWDAARGLYFVDPGVLGDATPGDPSVVYSHMQSNSLIGATRLDTIHRVLEWARGLRHFLGDPADYPRLHTARNYVKHWQYAGNPPVSRILSGTVREDDPLHELHRYTAGCWGTSALLSLMLRTVNIPADFTTHEAASGARGGHALPHFMHEGLYLSDGDDPYNVHMKTGPWIPIAELPISTAQFDAWFGPSASGAEHFANIGRRACELAAKHLSGTLVLHHCADLRDHIPHAASQVYKDLDQCHSLAELESMGLWTRLDAKAAEMGLCVPPPPAPPSVPPGP
jgi:hypothetical protein